METVIRTINNLLTGFSVEIASGEDGPVINYFWKKNCFEHNNLKTYSSGTGTRTLFINYRFEN